MACAPLAERLEHLVRLLRAGRFRLHDEYAVQADVAVLLDDAYPVGECQREARLSARDRVDFLVHAYEPPAIALEVKVRGARVAATLAQLARYAEHPDVGALVLLTGKAGAWPDAVGGKPLRVVSAGAGWL